MAEPKPLKYFVGIGQNTKLPIDASRAIDESDEELKYHTVLTDVPENAKFTDTTYNKISNGLVLEECVLSVPITGTELNQLVLYGTGNWGILDNEDKLFYCYEITATNNYNVSLATNANYISSGNKSLSIGEGITPNSKSYSVTVGKFNDNSNNNYLFAVGNGTGLENRKNIFEISPNVININTESGVINNFLQEEGL